MNKETRTNLDFIKIEATGFQDLCNRIRELENENEFLKRQNTALKFRAAKDSKRLMELESEIADLRFTHKFLTSEEAGKRFAEELLGGA